jgi:cytochrome c biogenesis protein ResB
MFYVAKPAGGAIKSFKSTLRVDDRETTVEVNRPFSYKGYVLYQSGYNPNDRSYTSLQVVKDPGVPVVYAGFGLMIVGLFIVFYLNPWLNQRRKQP